MSKLQNCSYSFTMEVTKPLDSKLTLAQAIDYLASAIMVVMGDNTIVLAARGIAQFMLLCKKMPLSQCIALVCKPHSNNVIAKLLRCQTDFLGPTPRPVGIDLVSEVAAAKIQQSLDVKHVRRNMVVHEQLDRIKPQIKIDLAYSHPNVIWVRFYTKHDGPIILDKYNVLPVCQNVYEAYGNKDLNDMFSLLKLLENEYDADLILCSELPAFHYNSLLFLSNYVKFSWCYALNRNIFDPESASDIRTMLVYVTYGLMFLNTNNLTTMPKTTHGPLIACTGERPKIALSKFERGKVHINEGSRAMQTLNKASDFGTKSNFIEIISEINLKTGSIDNII